jgi:hypothetical protein
MDVKIYYSNTQLQKTARFIWDNNPYVRNWLRGEKSLDQLISYIKSMAFRQGKLNAHALIHNVENWLSYTGTGGFVIQFSSEYRPGDSFIDISIDFLVDASVGDYKDFLTFETNLMVVEDEELY